MELKLIVKFLDVSMQYNEVSVTFAFAFVTVVSKRNKCYNSVTSIVKNLAFARFRFDSIQL